MGYSRALLSGSTNGLPIPVAATAIASGTTIHTAIAGTASYDEIYVYASNTDSSDRTLTIGFGGVTDPTNLICKTVTIPANSPPIPIITGQNLQNGLIVKAAASVASVINLTGHVNRIQ